MAIKNNLTENPILLTKKINVALYGPLKNK